jgi:cytochrome c peroxidase
MRLIKLFVVALFLVPVFLGSERYFTSFRTTGQAGGLTAPTGVTASDNSYTAKVGLTWDTIRGATTYRIFRNTVNDPGTATDVGTTASNAFFDAPPAVGTIFFYWVRAENGPTVSAMSASDNGSRAVGQFQGPLLPLNPPPAPPGNQITATKAALGKALFWDEQLSSTRTVACGTCHFSNHGGSDARSIVNSPRATNPGADLVLNSADDVFGSPGVPSSTGSGSFNWDATFGFREQVTGRKSKSYIDAGFAQLLFWDGRATGIFTDPLTGSIVLPNGGALESQVLGPPVNATEMAHSGRDWVQVAARLTESKPLALSPSVPAGLATWIGGRTYSELFNEAFGTPEVTPVRIALAIATFERTLYSDRTPFDAAVQGITPLSPSAQRGQGVFNGNQCAVCHAGNLFSDNAFHYIGLRPQGEDPGRFAVTGNQQNRGEFRTPSLRNVELRGPYFHNGRFATLEDVVEFYNRGGDFTAPNFPAGLIRPRNLNAGQKADLVNFLKSLTDPRVAASASQFSRPVLYSESDRVPQLVGTGVAGTGGSTPQVFAIEPSLAGNPQFAVGVSNALGGSQAVLVINSTDPGTGPGIPATGSFARVVVSLGGSGAGGGWGSAVLAIPTTPAMVGATFFGRWYVTDPGAPGGVAVSQAFRFTVFGEATTAVRARHADFDGDTKTDLSVFRPSEANWYIQQSSNSATLSAHFGETGDQLAPADFDGDGKTDIGVFRNGAWFIQQSHNGFRSLGFGTAGDRAVPADYDGDGIDDVAVWRPSDGVWYILQSRDGFRAVPFGANGDRPAVGDFDGDGKSDPAVYRDGAWYLLQSTGGFRGVSFGLAEDRPVMADYDGDSKTDIAVWRSSTGGWYYLRSSDQAFAGVTFGIASDSPAPGDYDGDGMTDVAVFRSAEGNWYWLQSSNAAFRVANWGTAQDLAVPAANVP